MLAIDTNAVVRYLTGDHPEESARARRLIDGNAVLVSQTVMLESEWVPRGAYGFERSRVCGALRAFAGLPGVSIENSSAVALALDHAEAGMDFADALHLSQAEGCEAFVTFDRKLIRTARRVGIESVRRA